MRYPGSLPAGKHRHIPDRYPASGSESLLRAAGRRRPRGCCTGSPPPFLAPGSPEACGTRCPEQGNGCGVAEPSARPGRQRSGPENIPARTRAARESWQRAPGPGSAALFYPARNHLVYRKYLFALLVGTGVNYSTCERGVIWIKAAPVFIVWVSC